MLGCRVPRTKRRRRWRRVDWNTTLTPDAIIMGITMAVTVDTTTVLSITAVETKAFMQISEAQGNDSHT